MTSSVEIADVIGAGVGQGFDEYMNLVLEDAEELSMKKKSRKALGERLGGAGASLYLLT